MLRSCWYEQMVPGMQAVICCPKLILTEWRPLLHSLPVFQADHDPSHTSMTPPPGPTLVFPKHFLYFKLYGPKTEYLCISHRDNVQLLLKGTNISKSENSILVFFLSVGWLILHLFIACVWMFFLHVCLWTLCVGARRGRQISWNWNCGQLWVAVWVLGRELLQEQYALLTADPAPLSPQWCFKLIFGIHGFSLVHVVLTDLSHTFPIPLSVVTMSQFSETLVCCISGLKVLLVSISCPFPTSDFLTPIFWRIYDIYIGIFFILAYLLPLSKNLSILVIFLLFFARMTFPNSFFKLFLILLTLPTSILNHISDPLKITTWNWVWFNFYKDNCFVCKIFYMFLENPMPVYNIF